MLLPCGHVDPCTGRESLFCTHPFTSGGYEDQQHGRVPSCGARQQFINILPSPYFHPRSSHWQTAATTAKRATSDEERRKRTRDKRADSAQQGRENERKSEKTHFENTFRSKFGYSGYLLSLSPLQNLRNTCRFFLRAFSYKTDDKTFAVLRFAYILYKQGKHSGI